MLVQEKVRELRFCLIELFMFDGVALALGQLCALSECFHRVGSLKNFISKICDRFVIRHLCFSSLVILFQLPSEESYGQNMV